MAKKKASALKRLELSDQGMHEASLLDDSVYQHLMSDPVTEDEIKLALYRLGGRSRWHGIEKYITDKRRDHLEKTIDNLKNKGFLEKHGDKVYLTEKGAAYYEQHKQEKQDDDNEQ